MTQREALVELESTLELFIERVVARKTDRLDVLGGLNRLDSIVRSTEDSVDLTTEVGNWFASYNRWLSDQKLRPGDTNRISKMLDRVKARLDASGEQTPARSKISSEIDRWQRSSAGRGLKIVLRRGNEQAGQTAESPKPEASESTDTLERFRQLIGSLQDHFEEYATSKQHLLSALDDALQAAEIQKKREALILSALIIYYLKQADYKVDPYVARLRAAEKGLKGGSHA